jgi:hypothetical protein
LLLLVFVLEGFSRFHVKHGKNLLLVGTFNTVLLPISNLPADLPPGRITSRPIDLLVQVAKLAQRLIVAGVYDNSIDPASFFNIGCQLFLEEPCQLRST